MIMLPVLLANLLPLYILIGLGWLAGKYLDVTLKSIARIILFVILPVVTFGAIVRIEFDPAYLLLPFILYGVSLLITLSVYKISGKIWQDGNANLLGAGSVNGNAIYFGLPIILTFFGPEAAGIYLFLNMGPQINNITLAYFLVARSNHGIMGALKKLMEFPVFHAAWLAIFWSALNLPVPTVFTRYADYAAGATVILGMMMIGIALSKIKSLSIDPKLIAAFFSVKFIIWPLAALALILFDSAVTNLFDTRIYQIIMIYSMMPHIGNLVAYAAENNLHPERAATVVLFSSLFTLISIPAAFLILQMLGMPVG